jgi:transcriptional regulator of acetoin/glycerol metabolism
MSVLILGETGVGKEHLARRLHALSNRRTGPFVPVNCGALPESLIDSELFGYEEGAFTGARRRGMPGRVREANGGILFLDEIGDMPLDLQARLLRVLQERQVTPLGGRPSPVDFALICATHHDLRALVAEGAFRADLFYRLQDYSVRLPALRERMDRGDLIKRLFLAYGGRSAGLELDEELLNALMRYSWPGNIRELVSALRGMIALAQPGMRLEPADLPPQIREEIGAGSDGVLTKSIALTETTIAEAFKAANGCVTEAARLLGVHRSTLYRRLPKSS